jgi:putative transposase
MIPRDLIEDYLVDQEEGLKGLLTWFLNLVMQLEAMEQIEAEPYERADSRKAHRNGYKDRSLKQELANSNSRNHNSERFHFRRRSLTDIRVWRRL